MTTNSQSFKSWCGILRWALLLVNVLIAVLAGGCAQSKPYRLGGKTCDNHVPDFVTGEGSSVVYRWETEKGGTRSCGDASQVKVIRPVPFSMNYVEIDEQGVLVDRRQAEDAIANASTDESGGSYVVVFVHGWHHNAGSTDTNVQGFYDALALVSKWNPTRKVKGIYIGWRGDSLAVPAVRYLTFWDRKSTSDEVGRGALLEFLLRLERGVKANLLPEIEQVDNGARGLALPTPDLLKSKADNRLVVVGHSFGASVTFNALAHVYLERFLTGVHSVAQAPRFRGYGDLVVLVNPAIEAMRYMPFQSALQYYSNQAPPLHADFSRDLLPRLLVLSSEGDWATRAFFPAGRFASTFLENHQQISESMSPDKGGKYSEHRMDAETVGNFKGFHTHETVTLTARGTQSQQNLQTSFDKALLERCTTLTAKEVHKRLAQRRNRNNDGTDASGSDDDGLDFPDSGIRTYRRADNANELPPYILADIDEKIVKDHNDIGRPNLVCWINQLLDTREETQRILIEPR